MNRIEDFFRELRRRRVYRTAALYAGAAWVVLQGAGLAFPGLGVPDHAIRYVWMGALVGLPLVLVFAWRYQITAGGIVRTAPRTAGDGDEEHEPDALPLRRPDYLVLGALLAVALGAGYRLAVEIREVRTSPALASADASPNSVAVLPLQNVTGDPEEAYFVAGMHDALITTLSKISALRVISRRSAEVYRNIAQPARQTGRELGVAHLVEGSVFRTGDRVQINVQLVRAATDQNLWTESYERAVEDVLTLQKDVARDIAEQVRVELTPGEESRLASTRKVNPEVYETYLRGMYHLNRYTPEGVKTGLAYLRRAVEKDPDDPLAYAGLAQAYTLIGHGGEPPPGVFRKARTAAEKALELDPLFPEAHAAMAEIRLYYDWDWDGAERSFRRALQLNPSLEFAHAHYAWYHQLMGDDEKAIQHMQRAQQIAPVTPIFTAWLGWLYWANGELEKAEAEARKALELDAGFPWGLHVLGGVYAEQGRWEESVATYERLREVRPVLGRRGLARTYAKMGREQEARRLAARIAEDPGQKDLLYLGLIHADLGDEEEALRWFERAYEARVDWFPWFRRMAGPPLADHPRIERLAARLELPGTE